MQSKKRVSICVALIVISIIGISIVSAGWFSDLFRIGKSDGSNGGGELYTPTPAKAYANVTSPANPPVIVFVSKPYEPISLGNVQLNPYPNPTPGINFSFIALEDLGALGPGGGCGSANLPSTLTEGTNVIGNFSAPSNEQTRILTNCASVGEPVVIWGGDSCTAKNYSCRVTAQYYDRGLKGSFFWTISMRIYQASNNMWSNVNNTQTFQYNNNYLFGLSPSSINWTTNALVIGTVNVTSDYPIRFTNLGNINLSAIDNDWRINATRLNKTSGTPGPDDFIAAPNFTADDDASPCELAYRFADELNTYLVIDVGKNLSGIPNSDWKNVNFCAINVPTTITAGIYESRRNWMILTTND